MNSPQSALKVAVPTVLALIAVEAVISIAARWPAQFGGSGRPDQVLSSFLGSGGTALAPPLWLVVLLALGGAGLYAQGTVRHVANWLLVPVTVIMTVGVVGELFAAPTPDVPRVVQLLGGVVDGLCCLTLLVLSVLSLVATRRTRAAAQPVGH